MDNTTKEILLEVVNLDGVKKLLLVRLFDDVIDKKLQALVDDTTNPFDNVAKELVMPKIREAAEQWLDAQAAELRA